MVHTQNSRSVKDRQLLKMQVAIFAWLVGMPLATLVLDRYHMAVLVMLPFALWCMTAPLLAIGEIAIAIGYIYLLWKRRHLHKSSKGSS